MPEVTIETGRIFAELQERLRGMENKIKPAARSVIDKSATEVQKILKNEAKQYTLEAKIRNEAFSKKRTNQNDMTAWVKVTGDLNELKHFLHHYSKANGYIPKVKKTSKAGIGSPKRFMAKFHSGHEAIVQRVPGKTYENPTDRINRHLDPTKIRVLFGPSVPMMLDNSKKPINERVDLEKIVRQKMEETIQKVIENAAKE